MSEKIGMDISIDIEDLEDMIIMLEKHIETLSDPLKVLAVYASDRREEIWVGSAAEHYWNIISAHMNKLNRHQKNLIHLHELLSAYLQKIIETEEEVSELVDSLND